MADDPRPTEATALPEGASADGHGDSNSRQRPGPASTPDSEANADRELLLDREARVEAAGEGPFGRLGQRFDRRSPFWIGLMGGLGVGAAYIVGRSIIDARQVLLLVFLALFIAVGLEPLVALLHRHGVRRGWAVLIVTLVALGAVGGLLAAAIPPLVNETSDLVRLAPHYLQDLNDKSSFLGNINKHFHLVTHLKSSLSHGGLSSIASGVVGAGKVVVGLLGAFLIVVVMTVYFLADMPRVTRTIYRLVPRSRRARAGLLIDEMFARVGGYVLGNVITSVIAGVGTLVWLEIFSVPYPLLLSVFVGFMDLIPIVGSTVAGIIVALVALTVSWPIALATAIFYVVYRNLEDYLITPKVMNRTVKVSGLVTVIAVVIGGALLGIIGALIAIPIAAAIKLVLDEVTFPRLDAS
ncbi:MAG TPA: AI-2E family transporter [Solirubrobacteraceae bacterium]|jgi:predicted PurR-regulated permease PerM